MSINAQPTVINLEKLLIAGVPGSGDETARAWQALTKIRKLHPLSNQLGETGYEVRLYAGEGPGKIHVGVAVKDEHVPPEYKVFTLPAAPYAEFTIHPASGYESANAAMDTWLAANEAKYRQAQLDGVKYIVEVYDKRYKGDKDPDSVVGCLIPLAPAENPFTQMVKTAVKEFSDRIEEYAGATVRRQVMQGRENMQGIIDPVKGALDYKDAVEQLEQLTDKPTCQKIMRACGRTCQSIFDQGSLKQKELRQQYATEAAFLADLKPDNATSYELKGKELVQRFAPRKLFPHLPDLRCACMLIGGLPAGVNASATVCECSRGFTQQHWETVLGRPVQVDIADTPIIGNSEECVFIVHL